MSNEWQSIDTAPKDGTIIYGQECNLGIPRFALYRCVWKNGAWREIHFKTIVHPEKWKSQ